MKPSLIAFLDTSNKRLVCRLSDDSGLCTRRSTKGQKTAFQDNYFVKVLLINSLPKHCIFADSLFIVFFHDILVLFFHDKLLFRNEIEYIKPLSFFSICRLHVMLFCLYNRNSSAKLLKTGEADEAFKITESKKIQAFSSWNIT